jgi:uncharacterized protein (TIGR03437 family)
MNIRVGALLVVLLAGVAMVPGGRQAQIPQPPPRDWTVLDPSASSFVIVATEDGTACRLATREEFESLRMGRGREDLRQLGAETGQFWRTQQAGLRITLRATSQLNANQVAREAFLRAATYWESIITNPIHIVIDVDFGPTRFGAPYPNQNVIGSTSGQILGLSDLYPDFRNQLVAAARTPQLQKIFEALPQGSLPTDLGPTQGVYTPSPVLRALGFIPASADPTQEMVAFGPPPSIGFNSNFAFDFDPSDGIDFNKIDFNATAIHEIGHLLGFSSFVGELERVADRGRVVDPAVNVWDFYRFRPGVTLNTFSTAPRLLLAGGDHLHFAGLGEAPLSTSRLDGQSGDGRQAPHWKDDAATGQFIGIMDPTATFGLREEASAKDLLTLGHFGYQINPSSVVAERLVIDRNQAGGGFFSAGPLMVNRLSPSRYPAQVRSVLVSLAFSALQPSPSGAPLRIVVFQGGENGQPPSTPTYLFDQTFQIPPVNTPTSGTTRIVEFAFDGPTITSGDLFVGVQATGTALGFGIDTSLPDRQRSFVSQDNGATFRPLNTVTGGSGPAALVVRAVVGSPFGNQPVPTLTQVSPTLLPAGGQGQTMAILGQDFQPGSVVRWNGEDRLTTFITSSLLEVSIPSGDLTVSGTAQITVATPSPGGGISPPQTVTIGTSSPVPVIASLDPPAAMRFDPGVVVNVFGTNLIPSSVVRVNGNDRPTTYLSSRQVTAELTSGDLLLPSPLNVTVFNPGSGGGLSNTVNFVIPSCNYAVSQVSQSFQSGAGSGAIILTPTNQACRWTATSNVPWVRVLNPLAGSGSGKYVVTYDVSPNMGAPLRTGRLTLGGQIVLLRQAGLLTGVSAASFAGGVTPNSIVAAFGADLALETLAASQTPLPTNLGGTIVEVQDAQTGSTRFAELFFVSPEQVNFLMPAGLSPGNTTITIRVLSTVVSTGVVNIARVSPALFSANANGEGVAAANLLRVRNGQASYEPVASLNQSTRRFEPLPLQFGPEGDRLFLVLYGTGVRGRLTLDSVQVRVGDLLLSPIFAQQSPDFLGVDQINVELPRSLVGRGPVEVQLIVEGVPSNRVQLILQ